MRIAKKSDKRWLHPWYRYAYCYPRTMKDGAVMIYTSVDSNRKATGMIWKPANKKRALALLEKRRLEMHSPVQKQQKQKMDMNEALKHFFKYKIHNVSKPAKLQYMQAFKNFIPPRFSFVQLDMIEEYIAEQLQKSELSPNTNWKRVQRIRKFFSYCHDKRWIPYNPISKEMIPKYKDKEVKVPSENNISKLIEYFKHSNSNMHDFIVFLCLTGVRIQEAIDIQIRDVYDDKIVIHGKGGEDRVFPLTIDKLNILTINGNDYDLNDIVRRATKEKNEKFFLWKNQQTPAKNLRQAVKKLDIEKITAHSLRRYAINRWRQINISLEMRSLLAGNSEVVQKKNYLKNPDIEYFEENI